jgi:hypothetical protein
MAGRDVTAPDRAESLVLGWARSYTRGLDDQARQRRLAELASDCHEQRRWGGEVGASPVAVATSMVARTLAGIPADLLWRQGQIAASRDRSPNPGGRSMGRWIKDNWWVALAGLLGAFEVVLGVGLPFEDRTVGALVGGIVIALLGISMLAGIVIRRRNRRIGGVLIAVGTLPTFPFFWTVVLPLLGLAVMIPAMMDAADAAATGQLPAGSDTADGVRQDLVLVVALVGLAAGIVASLVIGTQTAAAALCAPPLALVIARLAQHRLPMPTPLTRLALTAFLTGAAHAVLLAVAVLLGDGSVDLGQPIAVLTGAAVTAIGTVGLVAWVVGMLTTRDRARPA